MKRTAGSRTGARTGPTCSPALYRSILAEVEAPLQTGMSALEMARFLDRPLNVSA